MARSRGLCACTGEHIVTSKSTVSARFSKSPLWQRRTQRPAEPRHHYAITCAIAHDAAGVRHRHPEARLVAKIMQGCLPGTSTARPESRDLRKTHRIARGMSATCGTPQAASLTMLSRVTLPGVSRGVRRRRVDVATSQSCTHTASTARRKSRFVELCTRHHHGPIEGTRPGVNRGPAAEAGGGCLGLAPLP